MTGWRGISWDETRPAEQIILPPTSDRLVDGDLDGALTLACGAVDTAASSVYATISLVKTPQGIQGCGQLKALRPARCARTDLCIEWRRELKKLTTFAFGLILAVSTALRIRQRKFLDPDYSSDLGKLQHGQISYQSAVGG